MQLRPYQEAAVESVFRELTTHRSTLMVAATGTGKTITFAAIAKRWRDERRGRVLVIAHRKELIEQAVDKIESSTPLKCAVEMAESRASNGGLFDADVVVGSVQSLQHEGRRSAYPRDAFGLVIVDESHRVMGASYGKILEHFAGAKVLGVTATPDRTDGLAMGAVFESVAFQYDIRDAIDDGHLVPIRQKAVMVDGLDLSAIRTTAGDLNEGDLEKALMEDSALLGVVKPLVELHEDRPTMVFGATVKHAHRLAELLREHGQTAVALDGTTAKDVREAELARFRRLQTRFLCNVGLFTEGFDEPRISCIAMCRPTKSRLLYTQVIGRALRLSDGKADALILDFEGNAGRHKLVTPADVLGGREKPDVVERAKLLARTGAMTVTAALDLARAAIAKEHRDEAIKRARYKAVNIDPFEMLGAVEKQTWWSKDPATDAQLSALSRMGIDAAKIQGKGRASALIDAVVMRREKGLCTYKQAKLLAKHGLSPDVSFERASEMITAIAANGWRAPDHLFEEARS